MNTIQCTLDVIEKGMTVNVYRILNQGFMRRRLLDIGLIEGSSVQCLQKSPCKNPVSYLIKGAIIILRNEDAKHILVQYQSE